MKDRSTLLAEQSREKEQLLDAAASELPLALVSGLLEDVKADVEHERENKENHMAIKKIKEFYNSYTKKKSSSDLSDFIRYMSNTAEQDDVDFLYNLSDTAWLQLQQ